MRILMLFSLGFCGACAACIYGISGWTWTLAILPVFVILAAFHQRRKRQYIACILILLGILLGGMYREAYYTRVLAPIEPMDGKMVHLSIESAAYSWETEHGIGCEGKTVLEGRDYTIRFYLNQKKSLRPGDLLDGDFNVRVMSKDPGNFGYSGSGIFLACYQEGECEVTAAENLSVRYFPAWIRHKTLTILGDTFSEDTLGFARSLLLGDTKELDYATDTALKVSGVRHVVAVSGLHISILCGLLSAITGKHKVLTPVISFPVMGLFAAAVGFTPSVLRACIMFALVLLAIWWEREYDSLTALALAALLLTIYNPYVVTSLSFQLSFGCVGGIVLFSPSISHWLKAKSGLGPCKGKGIRGKLGRWFVTSLSVTLGAMSITTPFIAYHFGAVSLIAPVTNLLILWMIPFTFYGIICTVALGSISLPLGRAVAWVVEWAIRYILWMVKLLARIPIASVYTVSKWIVLWLIFTYILLAICAVKRKVSVTFVTSLLIIVLCICLLASWMPSLCGDMMVSVLDVGQGQCVLLQCEGMTYLVDCGGDYDEAAADTAVQTLLSQGIAHIDGLIITHFDRDHYGGAAPFLTQISTDAIYLPKSGESDLRKNPKSVTITENTVLSGGNTRLTMFPGAEGESSNDGGICVLFQKENCDILILGDRSVAGEEYLLEQMDFPEIEVLVVGHHGSKTSTGNAILTQTNPQWAVISVGKDNSYGHPAQQVLEKLEDCDCRIWRTDLQGTFTYRG